MNSIVIGIDTSNYTTSLAAADQDGRIISDRRKLLTVKPGERGLRQQEAFFQHVANIPSLFDELITDIGDCKVDGISCSTRPRPVEGSYMPVFSAGESFARVLAGAYVCPLHTYSHQEGHVAAASHGTPLEGADDFVFFHLSGGTTEAVMLPEYEMVGKTLDISFGQLIDRAGVALGMDFPCGREMDGLAMSAGPDDAISLPVIKVKDGTVNLSGIESACQRYIGQDETVDKASFSGELFSLIADALKKMTVQIKEKTGMSRFLFAGGVSSSQYISRKLQESLPDDIEIYFGKPELCRDNAVGTALLGGKDTWR